MARSPVTGEADATAVPDVGSGPQPIALLELGWRRHGAATRSPRVRADGSARGHGGIDRGRLIDEEDLFSSSWLGVSSHIGRVLDGLSVPPHRYDRVDDLVADATQPL
jgi:hypothetical protein